MEQINNSHYSHPFDGTVSKNSSTTQEQGGAGPGWLHNTTRPSERIPPLTPFVQMLLQGGTEKRQGKTKQSVESSKAAGSQQVYVQPEFKPWSPVLAMCGDHRVPRARGECSTGC